MSDPRYRRDYDRKISSTLTSEEYDALSAEGREDMCRSINADLYQHLHYRFPAESPSADDQAKMGHLKIARLNAIRNFENALEDLEEAKHMLDYADTEYAHCCDDFERKYEVSLQALEAARVFLDDAEQEYNSNHRDFEPYHA